MDTWRCAVEFPILHTSYSGMIKNLHVYLCSTDAAFSKCFNELEFMEKRVRQKIGIVSIEPSITQVAIAMTSPHERTAILGTKSQSDYVAYLRENPDLFLALKGCVYNNAQVALRLKKYVWSKKEAIADEIQGVLNCINQGLLLPSLILLRSGIEQIADAVLLDEAAKSMQEDCAKCDKILDELNVINAFSETLQKHFAATRIDWETYLTKSFRDSKKKNYKTVKGYVDVGAQTILNSIDVLDNKIKGCRMAYEFICEFAHPNIGAYFLSRSGKSIVKKNSDFIFLETILSNQTPSYAIDSLKQPILDCYELLLESGHLFENVCVHLDEITKFLTKISKEQCRIALDTHAGMWSKNEPCPCLSGHTIGVCCGKRIKLIK